MTWQGIGEARDAAEPRRQAVPRITHSLFADSHEVARWEAAVRATEHKRAGAGLFDTLERICAAAEAMGDVEPEPLENDRQLPPADRSREPGEEG